MVLAQQTDRLAGQLNRLKRFIGNTPLFPINGMHNNVNVKIFAKLEFLQYGQSIKSRVVHHLLYDAISSGELNPQKLLIDACYDDVALAYASVAVPAGIKVKLFLCDTVSPETLKTLSLFKINYVLTPKDDDMVLSRKLAMKYALSNHGEAFFADSFNHRSNWLAHYDQIATEIINQTFGNITHFVSGMKSSGTITGTTKRLREYNKKIKSVLVLDENQHSIISKIKLGRYVSLPHFFEPKLFDEMICVKHADIARIQKDAITNTGLMLSYHSAKNLAASIKLSANIDHGVIITIFPDNRNDYVREASANN